MSRQSSKTFNRRRFLLGSGGLIALPLFESLVPEKALAQSLASNRAIFMNFPMGVVQDSWKPIGTGTSFQLPDQLSSLAPYKSDILMPVGLNNYFAGVDNAGDHARATGCYLTCVRINKSEDDIRAGTSIDRVIAEKLNFTSSPKWLVLTPPHDTGADSGYGTPYKANISWISPTTPANRITDTQNAFATLFPDATNTQPTTTTDKKAKYKKSILDGAVAEANALSTRLGSSDRMKLDEYLTSVREVENSIATDAVQNPMACSPGANPGSTEYDYAKFVKTMLDLIVLASICDRSKVISFLVDLEGGDRTGVAGVVRGHHQVSHYSADPTSLKPDYMKISRWHAEQFAYFIGKMKSTKDAMDRPLLDSSAIVFGSGIHDGDVHNHNDLPIIVAGRANGLITPGRAINTPGVPLANLWVSVANIMVDFGIS